MRFFIKVFLCTIIVVAIAFSVGGYFLISGNFNISMDRETQRGLEEYQLLKFTLQSGILNAQIQGELTPENLEAICAQTATLAPEGNLIAVHTGEREAVFSSFPDDYAFDQLAEVEEGELLYTIQKIQGKEMLVVFGRFVQSEETVYLSSARDISDVVAARREQTRDFIYIDIIVVCVSAVVMLIISYLLTRPIQRLTRASSRLAAGNYSGRMRIHSHDEIGTLAESFNAMAATIEEKMAELELNAKQKEDFVANFAHELKTPLTSVIGYADMLSKKERDPETVYKAASYILSEGKRLESLSLKLMDLIVLGRQEFDLERVPAKNLLFDVAGTLAPLMAERQVELQVKAQVADVAADRDLMKTLIINLIDNSAKAGAKHVALLGEKQNGRYMVAVQDDGQGISETEITRITEAFYMVDKSRSRAMHGAGLGLSIASKIAEIHGTKLTFESQLGEGTRVSIELRLLEKEALKTSKLGRNKKDGQNG